MNARRPDVIHPLSEPVMMRHVVSGEPCARGICKYCGCVLVSAVRANNGDVYPFKATCGACAKARR